ncbi:MAG: NUDIX hydrolase [Alphaproteobacteria bacterium]|nr:NUDIX hydrolase [Alphaproteobacteria bacterium]OJV15097.1 MAG: hypothetical protein BGO27_06635 [Alphaproteobacteria bacterium 33-17]
MAKEFMLITECAIECEGKFLVIKRPSGSHAGGLLAFPGGGVEQIDSEAGGDFIKNATIREAFEEVGIQIAGEIHYVTSNFFMDTKTGKACADVIYYTKVDNFDVTPNEREVPEYFWLTYEEMISMPNCPEWHKKYMKAVIDLRGKLG